MNYMKALSFVGMMGNYEERKVARFEEGDLIVSTCRVTDSTQPYETAVSHPRYNDGAWVIVEQYDDEETAAEGHEKWVAKMTTSDLPEELYDVSQCGMVQIVTALTQDEEWRTYERQEQD